MQSKVKKVEVPITKGVPIPQRKRPLKYKWDEMEVGDSMIIPFNTEDQRITIRNAAHSYGKKHKIVFETRTVPEGLGIWRTK